MILLSLLKRFLRVLHINYVDNTKSNARTVGPDATQDWDSVRSMTLGFKTPPRKGRR